MIKSIASAGLMASVTLTGAMAQEKKDQSKEGFVSVFDGKSLAGWVTPDGQAKYWSVKDGAITGGDLENRVPRNVWIILDQNRENFVMTFKVRFINGDGGGLKNSGIQIRSIRHGSNIAGYQVDAGPPIEGKNTNGGLGYWGYMWDEHRRNRMVGTPVDAKALRPAVKDWDWNEYKIVADGKSIKSWINGVAALDYTEKDANIAADGLIALQAHSGGKFLVQFKDIEIKDLAPTPGSVKWADLKKKK
ncbi:3-keto-disaccharide hydrolase [Rubritalea tangerina]